MRDSVRLVLCILLTFTIFACSNGESNLENKWQLRQYQYADGTIQTEDSVFYNFMKGSYTAICILPNGLHKTFIGNYFLNDNKLSIVLVPGQSTDQYFKRYFNWDKEEREFEINKLTSSVLQLNYKDEKLLFRKY